MNKVLVTQTNSQGDVLVTETYTKDGEEYFDYVSLNGTEVTDDTFEDVADFAGKYEWTNK